MQLVFQKILKLVFATQWERLQLISVILTHTSISACRIRRQRNRLLPCYSIIIELIVILGVIVHSSGIWYSYNGCLFVLSCWSTKTKLSINLKRHVNFKPTKSNEYYRLKEVNRWEFARLKSNCCWFMGGPQRKRWRGK